MINTNCKDCVFAIGANPQTGCTLSRAQKLEIEIMQDGFYSLKRFCNTYRPEQWLSELSLDEYESRNQIVLKEVEPRIGFFVILDTSLDGAIQALTTTLNDIKEQELHQARYVVVMTDKVEYNQEIQALLVDMFDFEVTEHNIVQTINLDDKNLIVDECFKYAKNGWIYVTSSGERVNRKLISKIHQRINVDMKKLVIVTPYDKMNGLIFQASLFKFLNGNKQKIQDDGSLDDRPFLEKVSTMDKTDLETIMTWDQFNEC